MEFLGFGFWVRLWGYASFSIVLVFLGRRLGGVLLLFSRVLGFLGFLYWLVREFGGCCFWGFFREGIESLVGAM